MKTENELFNELKDQTTSDKEAEELFSIVNNLNKFSELKLTGNKKNEFLNNLYKKPKRFFPFWRILLIPSLTFAALLLLISAPLVLAQKSLPGEALYPLKKISENAVVIIRPQMKEDVIIRRSEEVKKLVEGKKEQKIIKETLREYKEEVKEVRLNTNEMKNNHRRKEIIEKSLEKLREAKEKSEDEDKMEIEKIIKELGEDPKKDYEEENNSIRRNEEKKNNSTSD